VGTQKGEKDGLQKKLGGSKDGSNRKAGREGRPREGQNTELVRVKSPEEDNKSLIVADTKEKVKKV